MFIIWLVWSVVLATIACVFKWKIKNKNETTFFAALSVVSFVFALFDLL